MNFDLSTAHDQRTGGCLCGGVRLSCRTPGDQLQACHCVQCQRWTGGGALVVARIAELTLTNTETIGHYHASNWGERCFCTKCGSALYWCLQGKPPGSIAVGLLDDQSGLVMVDELFTDHRQDWLPAWPGARQSTEAEEFARLKDDSGQAEP